MEKDKNYIDLDALKIKSYKRNRRLTARRNSMIYRLNIKNRNLLIYLKEHAYSPGSMQG